MQEPLNALNSSLKTGRHLHNYSKPTKFIRNQMFLTIKNIVKTIENNYELSIIKISFPLNQIQNNAY